MRMDQCQVARASMQLPREVTMLNIRNTDKWTKSPAMFLAGTCPSSPLALLTVLPDV